MKIFAIDTSHSVASCALYEDGQELSFAEKNTKLSHSEAILPLCEQLIGRHGLAFSDMALFAVDRGPGSFTGLRIGISAVKGFALALDAGAVGVSALMAAAVDSGYEGLLCPILRARGQEYFYALYQVNGFSARLMAEESAMELTEIKELAQRAGARITENLPNARGVAKCAYALYQAGERGTAHSVNPVYLKLSQAERNKQGLSL